MINFFSLGEFSVSKFKFGDVSIVFLIDVCCCVFGDEKLSFKLFLLQDEFCEVDVVGIIFLLYSDVFIYKVFFEWNIIKIS